MKNKKSQIKSNINRFGKGKEKSVKRKYHQIDEDILRVLKLHDVLSTKEIADKTRLNYTSAKKHLEFLEFKEEVVSFKRGLGTWTYWKIKR